MNLLRGRILLLFLAFWGSIPTAKADDWYRWRGPDQNGISRETGWFKAWPATGPKQLWKASIGIGFSSMVVSQGKVYATGNTNETDTVWCLNAVTGVPIWKHSYSNALEPKYYEGGPLATPTVDGNRVYTVNKFGLLHCFDALKGTVLWSNNIADQINATRPTWGYAGSATVDGDKVILNIGKAGTALDKQTGKVIWTSGPGTCGYSTPVLFGRGGERYATMLVQEAAIAIRVRDGQELWRYPWKTMYDVNAPDPIPVGDKVFLSSGNGHGAALIDPKGSSPEKIWENQEMKNQLNSSILWQGFVYGVDDEQLRCIALDTGEVKWTDKPFGKGSLMMADGKLIGLSEKGELIIFEPTPAEYKPLARAQVLEGKCWTVPVLANGRIYCRNAAGDLVCVDVRGGRAE